MDKKIGAYICTGCGLGEALDMEKLSKVATSEYKAPVCKTHPFLCSEEGVGLIKNDMEAAGVNTIVIAACSPRVHSETFVFDPSYSIMERVNLREQVIWSHPPKDEDTQMLAEDYLRMGLVKARKSEIPEPYLAEGISKTILVVGGGITGVTAAIEAARAGSEVILVEKRPELGGFANKLHRELPQGAPYQDLEQSDIKDRIEEVKTTSNITIYTSAEVKKIAGGPGVFDVTLEQKGNTTDFRVGSIVLATGWQPYDASKLDHLGFGKYPNVITNVMLEEMASNGGIKRPSDGQQPQSIAFIQCAGSRDKNHLPYCSSVCCLTSLKQATYIREQNPEALVYIFYKDMRTPGHYENFYAKVQEDEGIFLTKGEIADIKEAGGGNLAVEVTNTLLGEDVRIEVDMVVLATGIVPSTSLESEEIEKPAEPAKKEEEEEGAPPDTIIWSNTLNLDYRQGPELPALKYGFPDSHFICFPYETRRTGIYAAGCVRAPMDTAASLEDAAGAALKAIQCVELTAQGKAVHPRVGDTSYPDFFMQRCTQCKRCTVECPFGAINEDEKFNPIPSLTRCRRCATCLGACPERIINFKNYSIDIIASMIKAIEVPEEDEEKPRILCLACENDAYPALDMAGINRLSYSPYLRVIPLRCLGSINLVWIADALSAGFDGILLLGCKHGDDYQCHFVKGSELANYRIPKVQETLNRLVLEAERIRSLELSINEFDRLPGIIDDFAAKIDEIGPNPYKEF
ncbi:MAG: FAD-dependent oxidoreductase [bacterium]